MICAKEGCTEETYGSSRLCVRHHKEMLDEYDRETLRRLMVREDALAIHRRGGHESGPREDCPACQAGDEPARQRTLA